jgi:tetratricopeptide (TPR) repeat protein
MAWFAKSAKSLNDSGTTYALKGQYDRAIAYFDEAVKLDPKFALVFYNRGLTFKKKGDYDRAIADYGETIKLTPNAEAAFMGRGLAYMEKGQLDRAIADYDEAIKLNLQYAPCFYNRGRAYEKNGQYKRAIADYDEAIRLRPNFNQAINTRNALGSLLREECNNLRDSVFSAPTASAIFPVGIYRLDASIEGLMGLVEFSPEEYEIMGRQFESEKNYNAPPVRFLALTWNLKIGTAQGKIYKIAPYLVLANKADANPIVTETLQYCIKQLGNPAEQKTGLFVWDMTDGNVILQTDETTEGLSIALFLTSGTVRNLKRL